MIYIKTRSVIDNKWKENNKLPTIIPNVMLIIFVPLLFSD